MQHSASEFGDTNPQWHASRPCKSTLFIQLAVITVLACFSVATRLPSSAFAGDPHVESEVDGILNGQPLGTATITIAARDLDSSEDIIDFNATQMMIPASNMKLITTGAALLALGPDFSFRTKTLRDDEGRIIIVGSGDPGLGDPELLSQMNISIEDLVDYWADDLIQSGITTIPELIIDDRIFDHTFHHPQWMTEDLIHAYGAQVSGFNLFGNTVHFFFKPARSDGTAPTFSIEPNVLKWVTVVNRGKTLRAPNGSKRNSLWLDRKPGTNEFIISGNLRRVAETNITIHDPAAIYGLFIARQMRGKGIDVKSVRTASASEHVVGTQIGRVIQTKISTILEQANTNSNNLYAEALLKRLGYEATGKAGSWAGGAAVMRTMIAKELGPALATQIIISDGSGLSRDNRVSANMLTEWLDHMNQQEEAISNLYIDSLADAGESGTLRKRFKKITVNGEVDAKSGYMRGVSCLSGYIRSKTGRTAAFSILINDIPASLPISKAKEVQEKIVRILDRYLKEKDATVVTNPTGVDGTDSSETRFGG